MDGFVNEEGTEGLPKIIYENKTDQNNALPCSAKTDRSSVQTVCLQQETVRGILLLKKFS